MKKQKYYKALTKDLKAPNNTDSQWAYHYCRYVKDRPEVYKHIIDSEWAYNYCRYVRDIPEVYKNITKSQWAYYYCRDVEDRPEIYRNIIDSEWVYRYCRYVKDRPEVYKYITDPKHINIKEVITMTTKEQKYYKVLTKDLKAPNNTGFSYKWWRIKSFKVEDPIEMCENGIHLYTSLENLSIGTFGERVFEAIPVGEYISGKDKICCRKIKLIKELNPEDVKDSAWAYNYCRYVEDRSGVYKNIKNSGWAYYYCRNVKDRPEIYKNIIDSEWAYYYCRDIKDRPEVYKYIIDSKWAYKYCHDIKDRPEVHRYITD